ncbi:MetQ/NlpA family ABC transporter substrate-binding protein [Caldalkalibacillus mannanilyticus]|uniref:MetQ/NlpA family ABC transporter substrate-binding protein n=1 Tax=Caldalkalibacillus mannanilyticus TaxID=1418 RepID=UPI000468E41F|nr:MetQ/NlpA family ABC transporter substrate-binding protein [Caldalkalibacillus mannanilyticus]
MKKVALLFIIAVLSIFAVACGQSDQAVQGDQAGDKTETGAESKIIRVGATPVPHAEILEQVVKPLLAAEGIELEVVVFQDYVLPNQTLAAGDIEVNFFQHIPYLEKQNADHNYGLVNIGGVHIEPMGGYSVKHNSIDELPDGALILHPDSASEEGRILALLESKGLITLKEGVGFNGTVRDIVDNPKNFQFKGVEAATLTQAYVDGDLAIINTNYALQAGLSPAKDALILEGAENNPYANVLATVEANADNALVKKLVEAIQSEEVRQYIQDKYEGNIVPAF